MKVIENHDEKLVFEHTAICPICSGVETLTIEITFGCDNLGIKATCKECGSEISGFATEVE
ncbi:hypothetical protein [Halodesulfovibrio aestuarii]|uniref:hypothetical protein n=1 Tax=Halodesulfovibrio aestuarii TaxID=126333 RepID=UPI003D330338